MKELKDILALQKFDIDIDRILINIIMASAFVWLVYSIQHMPCFG